MDDNRTLGTLEAQHLAARRAEIHSLWNSWSWRLSRPFRDLSRKIGGHAREVEPVAASAEEAAQTIAAIHQSLSWRLTAPLRLVHHMVISRVIARGDRATDSRDVLEPADAAKWVRLQPIIEREAAAFSVSCAIHPADHIFRFIVDHPQFNSDDARVKYYFEDGARSARQFAELLLKHCDRVKRRSQVLEFASGYGCVTRHLALDNGIELESCDIHPAAIDFLQTRLGVHAIQSARFPEEVSFPHQYDFVFALSLLSHMPITTWTRWLVRLTQCARPGGVVAFTTHGMASKGLFGDPEVGSLGFWFVPDSEQSDLPTEEYGATLVTETFVRKNVLSIPSVELVETRLGYWWGHQDLYVLRKTA
jgi:2-polyprenyl-3-methyl-5-hydroxy-6-metoxy-1,4-benzoquinol methylase